MGQDPGLCSSTATHISSDSLLNQYAQHWLLKLVSFPLLASINAFISLWEWPLSTWYSSDVHGNGGTHSHLLQEYGWLFSPTITSGNFPWLSTEALLLVSDFVLYCSLLGPFFLGLLNPGPCSLSELGVAHAISLDTCLISGPPEINKVNGFQLFFFWLSHE